MIIYRYYVLCCISLMLLISYLHAGKPKLRVGSSAPDFTLLDENSKKHTLSDLRGHNIALIFYPSNRSFMGMSHCTQELCSIRDDFSDLQAEDIKILGVNPGSCASHKAFKAEHNFRFPLLSDPDRKVAKAYGAKRPFGLPIRRITVLINGQGIIVAVLHDINVAEHAQEIIRMFKVQ